MARSSRRTEAGGAGDARPPLELAPLAGDLASPDWTVRERAVQRIATLLRTIPAREQLDRLTELLELAAGDAHAEVRAAAARGVGALHHPRFDEIAARLQGDVDPYVRRYAEASVRRRGQEARDVADVAADVASELRELATRCPPDVLAAVHEAVRAEVTRVVKQVRHDSGTALMALDACHTAIREELARSRPSARRCVALLDTAALRRGQLERVVRNLEDLVRPAPTSHRRECLHDVVQEALALVVDAQPNAARVHVDVRVGRDLTVVIARDRVHEALVNVLSNAFDAIAESGSITVDADLRAHGDQVLLRIVDTGCGMRPEMLAKLYELGATTKQSDGARAGEHMGWGLKLARRFIVADNGGELDVQSEWGKGTTVSIALPTHRAEQDRSAP